MPFKVKVDISDARQKMKDLQENQLPWTIARSLTMTAQSAQGAVRKQLPSIFRLRNTWTSMNIRITAAEKKNLVAEIYTDTSNRQTGAPDYLPRQDYGGEKFPIAGKQHIAVPTKFLQALVSNGPIPEGLRPRVLMKYADQAGTFTSRRGKIKAMPALIRGMEFFLQRLKGGDYAIFGRRPNTRQPLPFYLLIPEARIKARFPMEQLVEAEVQRVYEENFRKAAIETMGSDLLRGTGIYIRF